MICYADGSEELYERRNDPNEWTNLAGDPKLGEVKRHLTKWLPKIDKPPAPNSRDRVLTYDPKKRQATWEGKPILPTDQVP